MGKPSIHVKFVKTKTVFSYIYPPGILKIGGDVKLKKHKKQTSPFVKL
jgi:hypothetical protein